MVLAQYKREGRNLTAHTQDSGGDVMGDGSGWGKPIPVETTARRGRRRPPQDPEPIPLVVWLLGAATLLALAIGMTN